MLVAFGEFGRLAALSFSQICSNVVLSFGSYLQQTSTISEKINKLFGGTFGSNFPSLTRFA